MHTDTSETSIQQKITVSDEVKSYINQRKGNFRVCTSCGGPILLSTRIKPPKSTDQEIYVGDHIIYISMYQARYIDQIDSHMIPVFYDV
jgi:hypothetical protein